MAEEKNLVEDLTFWRTERPDEWIMDRFIYKAKKLQQRVIEAEKTVLDYIGREEVEKAKKRVPLTAERMKK